MKEDADYIPTDDELLAMTEKQRRVFLDATLFVRHTEELSHARKLCDCIYRMNALGFDVSKLTRKDRT